MNPTARPIRRIFLDLDGVLCDFVGGACALFGADPARVTQWSLGACLGLPDSDLWGRIDQECEHFWADLKPYPELNPLTNACIAAVGTHNVCLLTSPSLSPFSAAGKMIWIEQHVPRLKRQFLIGPAKHLLAQPGHLLIDDFDGNVENWRAAGAPAILYPRPWNAGRNLCAAGPEVFKLVLMGLAGLTGMSPEELAA